VRPNRKDIWQPQLVQTALKSSLSKLDPRLMWRNPVMLIVEVGAIITTIVTFLRLVHNQSFGVDLQISIWLWFTVLFANIAEALAEGRGKAQAETLRKSRGETYANRLFPDGKVERIAALSLRKGDIVLVSDGEAIPGDGEIISGVALVDESAITGESAPVVREAGGDRSGVTGGTKVLSGSVQIRITADPGETFLDQMISMIESAKRQKTPNEKALEILLVGLTCLFIIVVVTLPAFGTYLRVSVSASVLIALLVCLMPTTIGGLLPAIGIAGMDRMLQRNVIAMSGRAVEVAGDVDVVLLDKTGTITLGNRMATEFIPAEGIREHELTEAALLASLADQTPEGRSIVLLAKKKLGKRGRDIQAPAGSTFLPFSAETRMSGIDWLEPSGDLSRRDRHIRKGSVNAIETYLLGAKRRSRSLGETINGKLPAEIRATVNAIAREGGTPLVVADERRVLGVVRLKDVIKHGIKERLLQLKHMGIQSVMITGDNPLTAATIAAEAGIDDFIAQARPRDKLQKIRVYQNEGHLVAMIGDGTNDAPALAQADLAVAMNAGTQASREAANMVDLDSNPTKLLDIVEIGKQILITRGALTTFSIANDVAKYFAIIPAVFVTRFPALHLLNIMRLATPRSAVLAAVIFNALIIPALVPLSLRGVQYRPANAAVLLRHNLLMYGLGGLLLPFAGIKIIDWILMMLHLG
jgi:K+-transporting ATPase ATPase B chain